MMYNFGHHDSGICGFFVKMGACRHGDSCNKLHPKPSISQTVLLPMMYPTPQAIQYLNTKSGKPISIDFEKKYLKKHFERFYADVWQTVMEFGRILELRVVNNLCEHLLGNVYIKFETESAAAAAVDKLKKKMYNGIVLLPEFSPVTDFNDACCKEDREGECKRGSACNFLHIKKVSRSLMDALEKAQEKLLKKQKRDRSAEGHGRKHHHHRKRSRSQSARSHSRGHRGDRDKSPQQIPDTRLCHICGKPGHISRDCQLKRG